MGRCATLATPLKRPYTLPTMKEVESIETNGYTVASTFSGAGGSCLGYRLAGFDIRYANEFIPAAQEVYRLNHKAYLDERDIREVTGAEILEVCNLKKGELDLLDGSPPCVAFSIAGKRDKVWGQHRKYSGRRQQVDDLFYEFIRLISEIQPKTFVVENVPALAEGKAKGHFKIIHKAMSDIGYKVSARVLDASALGVPQKRRRLFFVGVRKDLTPAPAFPLPQRERYSVEEALIGVAPATEENAHWLNPETKMYQFWHHIKPGEKFQDIGMKIDGKLRYYNHRKIDPKKPAPTIVQGSEDVYHWLEPRALSIPEVKRLSSFPDDFKLTGSRAKQWERMGRAVPPLVMKAVAKTVKEEILDAC